MQESSQLQEERKLERRGWVGCLLVYALAGIIMALVTALPDGLFRFEPTQPVWQIVLSLLFLMAATLAIGIAGLAVMLRLMSWSTEAERQRHQRGTAIFSRVLPGLGVGQEGPTSKPPIFRWQSAGFLLLLLVSIVGVMLTVSVVGAIVGRVLPGVPGILSYILTGALCLGVLFLLERTMRSRTSPKAVGEAHLESPSHERAEPGRSRAIGGILYFVIAIVPLIGVLSLLFRIPAPPLLMPILALAVCAVAFTAMNAVYIFAPFLWIANPVKRCEYDRAIARARLVERLSLLPGFYLNLHGVILLWAGRYEQARKTFDESIGEQRKEAMGGGSAALENIGCALAWQGQYDEAIKMFEGSIAITQQQAMVYSDLAEALLHQGADLPRALELTERAWTNQQASFEARWLSSYQGGQILANRAWALAKLGRFQEADETLARAFAIADKSFKPVLAGIYLRAGYVMFARGERTRADGSFSKGQQLDPQGHYGRLCAQELGHVD